MLTERIDLSDQDVALLESIRMESETLNDVLRRLIASVEFVDMKVAEIGVPQEYKND